MLAQPVEAFIIGSVGALITAGAVALLNKLKIDDPVGKTHFNFHSYLKFKILTFKLKVLQ